MADPSLLLPFLYKCGEIAHGYLLKHLTEEQVTAYLDYLHDPTTKHCDARRLITVDHGHPEAIFHAVED